MRLPNAWSFLLRLRVAQQPHHFDCLRKWWCDANACMKLMSASAGARGGAPAGWPARESCCCVRAPRVCTTGRGAGRRICLLVPCGCRAREKQGGGDRPNAKCHEQLYNLAFCRVKSDGVCDTRFAPPGRYGPPLVAQR